MDIKLPKLATLVKPLQETLKVPVEVVAPIDYSKPLDTVTEYSKPLEHKVK
jgi:hypothetical protein